MANTVPCGKCLRYYELRKPLRKGGSLSLHRGHCLAKTIYAANKPGDNVYPAGARVEELPYAMHKIKLVEENEIQKNCTDVKEKP